MPAFVKGFLSRMKNLSTDASVESLFDSAKEELIQAWKNTYFQQTYEVALH
jgi:hypothetical protein